MPASTQRADIAWPEDSEEIDYMQFQRILVAIDGSEFAAHALDVAASLAKRRPEVRAMFITQPGATSERSVGDS